MKICILSKMFPPDIGGAETYAYELANALGKNGHSVDVYTQRPKNDDEPTLHENVSVFRITKTRRKLVTFETMYYSMRVRQLVDVTAYDVVHGTLMPASTVALTPGIGMADVPLVVTSHGTSMDEFHSIVPATYEDYLLKYLFHPINVVMDSVAGRFADAIVAISTHSAERLNNWYRFDEGVIECVSHGVDTERFHPETEAHPSVSEDRFTALYVGRLGPRKGLDLAIAAVSEAGQDIEFKIAGTGRHADRLRGLALDGGVGDRVDLLGNVPDEELPSLYATADVLILPSTYEGFGLVVLEAMASGTPVIGTAVGGVTDIIDDGTNGYLIPRKSSVLANRLDTLASDSSLLDEMGSNARSRAEAMSWERVAEEIAEIYRNVAFDGDGNRVR